MAFGEIIAVQFVCKHGTEDALKNKIKKNGRSNGCMYSNVKIKYRLIIVKATKLLAKTGIFYTFVYICPFRRKKDADERNSIQVLHMSESRLSVHAVYTARE